MKLLKVTFVLATLCMVAAPCGRAQAFKQFHPDLKSRGTETSDFNSENYELRCRGGSPLHIVMTEGRRTASTYERMMIMRVYFNRGTQAADFTGSTLAPGQCAWVDRGVDPREPAETRQEIIYFGQEKQALHGDPLDRSPTGAERHPDSLNVPQYLSDPNHYWSFFVHSVQIPRQHFFDATYSRYWKPVRGNSAILGTQQADKRATGNRVLNTSTTGADDLNPQPLPPCEKCPKSPPLKRIDRKKPM